MSKLAHSNQETMDAIDRERAIADGNEDLICPRCGDFGVFLSFNLDGSNSFLCLSCCQEEEAEWEEANSQFGVGA